MAEEEVKEVLEEEGLEDEDDEDEDESVEDVLVDEDLEVEGESFGDIGGTILSSAPLGQGGQGKNLEEAVGREGVERDWRSDEEAGGVYDVSGSGGDLYGVGSGGGELYQEGAGKDLYSVGSGGESYDVGVSRDEGGRKTGDGLYDPGSVRMKSYDEMAGSRRKKEGRLG